MIRVYFLIFIFVLFVFTSCNSNSSSNSLDNKINSLQKTNDSLKQLINNSKNTSLGSTKNLESKTAKQMIIGTWVLQYDKYDFNNLSEDSRDYFIQLKNDVSSFSFTFNEDMTMSIKSELRRKEKGISKIDGVYRISTNNKNLEIERHSDEIILDEAVQKYKIVFIDSQNMLLKSPTIEYILKKKKLN